MNKKKKNIFKKIILGIIFIIGCLGSGALLISLFMYLLETFSEIFIPVMMGASILGIVGIISLVPKCIKIEKIDENDMEMDLELDPDMMRKKLYVVNSKSKDIVQEKEDLNKYAYCFDNNYVDVYNDEIIDDEIEEDEEYLQAIGLIRKRKKNH